MTGFLLGVAIVITIFGMLFILWVSQHGGL